MSDMDRTITYTYRILTNADAVSEDVSRKASEANAEVQALTQSEWALKVSVDSADASLKRQSSSIAEQVTLLMGMKSAVSGVTSGLIQMGIVEGENAERLQTMNQAFNVLCGFATGIKVLAGVQEALALASLKEAVISTYNSVLASPWKLALASAGLGAAAGVAMAYGTTSTTNNTNIIIEDSSGGQASTGTKLNSVISGGKIL